MRKTTPVARPDSVRKIRREHRRKLAIVYRRQAVPEQVAEQSAVADDELARVALRWGWPASRIRIMRDHVGPSRPGFTEMLRLIERRHIGLVLVEDLSRLSRNLSEVEDFLARATRARTLICVAGQLLDTATADLEGARLLWLIREFEIHNRVRPLRAAADRRGRAAAQPPRRRRSQSKNTARRPR